MASELVIPVEETFKIAGRGLILPTCLPVTRLFRLFIKRVVVERPDRQNLEIEANFGVAHVLTLHGSSKWVIILTFPSAEKEDIPAGSRVLVDSATAALLSE